MKYAIFSFPLFTIAKLILNGNNELSFFSSSPVEKKIQKKMLLCGINDESLPFILILRYF